VVILAIRGILAQDRPVIYGPPEGSTQLSKVRCTRARLQRREV